MRTPPKGASKIGVPPGPIDRTLATQAPLSTPDTNVETYTYFTKIPTGGADPGTQLLYTADRAWVKLTLTLETAGPVSVGQSANLLPVLGGVGVLLPSGTPLSWTLAKGNKFYIASTSINRVKVQIEPFAWLQAITNLVSRVLGALLPK